MRFSLIILLTLLAFAGLTAEIEWKQINEETYLVEFTNDSVLFDKSGSFTSILLENATYPVESGMPNLPFFEFQFAVPPKADIELTILSQETQKQILTKPIDPVLTIVPDGKTNEFLQIINDAKYRSHKLSPLETGERQSFRHTPYYTIRLNPVLYDHSSLQVHTFSKLVFQLKIIGDTKYFNTFEDPFSQTLDSFFVNPAQAKKWKHIEPVNHAKIPFESSQFWYKIELSRTSDQTITKDYLQQLPAFVQLSQLQLLTLVLQESGQYELKRIPLHIENSELYFSFPPFSTIPRQAWLTLGRKGNEENLPLQPLKPLQIYQKILSFEAYSQAKQPKNEVECLLISPQVYLSQAQELADFYERFHGLTSLVQDQQEIVDTYADGNADPQAIKSYIMELYNQNPASLQYVVLIGSGTDRGSDSMSLQEWYNLTQKNKILTFGRRDDQFVSLEASNFPTLPIGRIPAKTSSDLQMYISRVQEFTEFPNLGLWQNRLLLIADDENKGDGYEGINVDGLNHSQLIEDTANLMNDNIMIEKIFGFNYNMNEFNQKPGVTTDIIRSVNDGVLTWVYVGHGNPDVMGDEDYFIGTRDIKNLENASKLGLMIAASCGVSDFLSDSYDSIGEQLLFSDTGGSIVTIGASWKCSGFSNVLLTRRILTNLYHEYYPVGYALWDAKLNSTAAINNSRLYHCLGDPLLPINPPRNIGSIEITQPEERILQARQEVLAKGDFELEEPIIEGTGDIFVFDTAVLRVYNNYNYTLNDTFYTVQYWDYGKNIFRGSSTVNNNEYDFGFIVPDDIHTGSKGRIINYLRRQDNHYVSSLSPLEYSNVPLDVQSDVSPQVELFIDSEQFQAGDYVSTNPTVIARIEDPVGINISGEPGRKILIHLNKSNSEDDLYDATDSFIYETNSYQKGILVHQLDNISPGFHSLDFYVYNNFGNFTVESTHFYAQETGKIAIRDMLPYPNPMEDKGRFTFLITEAADVTLEIFTITGRKIRTIKRYGLPENYNEIEWNGRDQDGDRLANNTYFYKIKATSLHNRKTTEKIGTFIVYK